MLAIAEARCASQPHVSFREADALSLPFADDEFDAAIISQVYEYVTDMEAALAELFRVFKPGGRALIMDTDWGSLVWNAQDAARAKRIFTAWDAHLADPHLPRRLSPLLQGAGFEIAGVRVLQLLNTEYPAENYSHGMVSVIVPFVIRKGGVPKEEGQSLGGGFDGAGRARGVFFQPEPLRVSGEKTRGLEWTGSSTAIITCMDSVLTTGNSRACAGWRAPSSHAGTPHVHREIWKRAPGPEDVRRLWESPLRMAEAAEAKHHIRAMCAVGVSSMTRVDGWERLIDALPGYLENERVAALGEVGLDPGQYFGFSWDLEDQARCLEAQARMAAELKKPLILHTPTYKEPKGIPGRRGHARGRLTRRIQAPLPEDGSGSHRRRRVGPCAARGRSRGRDDCGFRA